MSTVTLARELSRLQDELLVLADQAQQALLVSVDTLKRRDLAGAQQLIALEQQIKKKRFAIEMDCLTLIVTQQPGDGYVRTISAILEMATELERIGACAGDNARIPFMVVEPPVLELLPDIQRMATAIQARLRRGMQAFVNKEAARGQASAAEANQVDALYSKLYQDLLTLLKNSSRKNGSRTTINQVRYLSRVARNLKGAADRATRIGEWAALAFEAGTPIELMPQAG
jgi:phosphate transport system protein